jgi:hypothetical protein
VHQLADVFLLRLFTLASFKRHDGISFRSLYYKRAQSQAIA